MFVVRRSATAAGRTSRMANLGRLTLTCTKNVRLSAKRWVTTRETGALMAEPEVTPLGLVKLLTAVLPGLYVGASISKTCAAFLEENDIFVPADDDDDDD